MSNSTFSPFTALALKVVGIVLILSGLLNYILSAIPLNFGERDWQIQFVGQLVNQGFIPMLGIALLILGYGIEGMGGSHKRNSLDLRFAVFILSSILGLVFLLVIPLHLSNVSQRSSEAFAEIRARAEQFESQIQQETQQLRALVENDAQFQQLEQAIESGQVQGAQLQQLQLVRQQVRQLRENPAALEQQIQTARNELTSRQEEAEKEERGRALKSSLSVGLTSLLLAIGYIIIGWTGFKSLS